MPTGLASRCWSQRMKSAFRVFFCTALSMCLAAKSMALAVYPDRPVTLIVPTPPGGPLDRVSRLYAQHLQGYFGQPVVVENKVGASGKIGVRAGLQAPRDGYTLIAVSPSIVTVNPVVDEDVGFDPLRDFEMLGMVARNTGVVATRADLPVSTMAELVSYAKAHPGQLNYASFGVGTSLHLFSEELAQTLGIALRHIPYKGESQAMHALIAGEVDLMLYVTAPVVPFVKSGRVKALTVTTGQRWAELPDVPSFAESGVPQLEGYTYHSWVGFLMPRDVPAQAATRLREGIAAVGRKPELRQALQDQGFDAIESGADAMRQTVSDELERNRRVVERGGIKLD
ncbi:Bug family tripartite tricarboxylate transporter substrate binding protein [Verticiella sediminum]|nr:tripartite tricarboxylate transporter substrate binding protein [Verticiella sediminum]